MAEAEELEAVERERARRRQAHGQTAPGKNASGNISPSDKGRARDKVAAAVGLGSGRTYDKATKVWEAGKANLPTVSAGNVSTTHEDKGRTLRKYFLMVQAVSINGSRKNTPTLPYLRAGLILIRGCARS